MLTMARKTTKIARLNLRWLSLFLTKMISATSGFTGIREGKDEDEGGGEEGKVEFSGDATEDVVSFAFLVFCFLFCSGLGSKSFWGTLSVGCNALSFLRFLSSAV